MKATDKINLQTLLFQKLNLLKSKESKSTPRAAIVDNSNVLRPIISKMRKAKKAMEEKSKTNQTE